MKKFITNVFLGTCTVGVILLIPLFLAHDTPIQVNIPRLEEAELTAQKEAAAKAEKEASRKARRARIRSCEVDADCIIVEQDPCGCAAGPQGVVAINVNYITDFNKLNRANFITKSCSSVLSTQKECSPSARAVCQLRSCKIVY